MKPTLRDSLMAFLALVITFFIIVVTRPAKAHDTSTAPKKCYNVDLQVTTTINNHVGQTIKGTICER